MFDVGGHLDELRSWPTERLEARRREVVRAKRRLEVEELDILRVLDERGRIDVSVGGAAHGTGQGRDGARVGVAAGDRRRGVRG